MFSHCRTHHHRASTTRSWCWHPCPCTPARASAASQVHVTQSTCVRNRRDVRRVFHSVHEGARSAWQRSQRIAHRLTVSAPPGGRGRPRGAFIGQPLSVMTRATKRSNSSANASRSDRVELVEDVAQPLVARGAPPLHHLAPRRRAPEQACPAVGGVGAALDVALLDQPGDRATRRRDLDARRGRDVGQARGPELVDPREEHRRGALEIDPAAGLERCVATRVGGPPHEVDEGMLDAGLGVDGSLDPRATCAHPTIVC